MKKQIIIFITALFFVNNLQAQDNSTTAIKTNQGFEVSLSYYGEMLLHPGIKVGLAHPILSTSKGRTKAKKRSNATVMKTTSHQLIGRANLGFYYHTRNHTNTFANIEVGYRLQLQLQKNEKPIRGMHFEILAGIGPTYYFLAGDTYSFDGETSTVKKNAGGLAWMKTVSVSMGGRIPNKRNVPVYWHIKPSIFWETPYNLGSLTHPVLEVGVSWKLP